MKNNESKKNKKFKFCILIYFLFWFKFSDMAFKKKIKILTWHIKMSKKYVLIIF